MLAINQILQGRYRITRQLGAGGMGAVYEAIDERFGEPIALKEIIIDLVDEKQKEIVSKAFEREAKTLAKAKHEAVPYVRDYFFELDRQFLVMELVEGKDLSEMLKSRGKPFPLEEVLKWMDQLLDAIDYLHNLKPPIIHRDIKPQNLKLGVRRRIKLLDFGIARSSDKSSATLTKQTFIGATLNYSPIEQILRVIDQTFREFIILKHKEKAEAVLLQDTDGRCDIYSLGGTFYHLLTNQVPVDATKRTLDIWEGKSDPLPHPSQLNPNIPPAISACLLKAMAVESDKRYSSAIEMQEALKGATAETKMADLLVNYQENITRAETLPIITKDDLRIEMLTKPLIGFQPAPTYPVEIPVSDTQPPNPNSGFMQIAETIPSGNLSSSDITSGSYLVGILPDEKKTSPPIAPIIVKPIEEEKSKNKKMFWVIPAALISFLAVGGLGGLAWIFIPPSPAVSNKQVSNVSISTPTVTPSTVTPTVTPITTPSETPANEPTPIPKSRKQETNPVVAVTPNKTPKPTTITPNKTPKPKPQQDPNCVFTNSCK